MFHDRAQERTWLDCFGCTVMDPWQLPGLLTPDQYTPAAALGMYAPMLESWLRYFPSSAMRIYNYQQLADTPLAVINQILRSLGALLFIPSSQHCPFARN
jgi:hypothetical protein